MSFYFEYDYRLLWDGARRTFGKTRSIQTRLGPAALNRRPITPVSKPELEFGFLPGLFEYFLHRYSKYKGWVESLFIPSPLCRLAFQLTMLENKGEKNKFQLALENYARPGLLVLLPEKLIERAAGEMDLLVFGRRDNDIFNARPAKWVKEK